MKRNSIFFKLFVLFLVSFLAASAFFVLLNNRNIKQNNIKIFTKELTATSKIISSHITNLLQTKPETLDAFVKNAVLGTSVRITVIERGGGVIADSESNPTKMDNHLNRGEVEQAFLNKEAFALRRSYTLNTDFLYTAVPLVSDGKVLAVLRLSVPLEAVSVFSYDFISKNYTALIFAALIAFAASLIISKYFGKKIAATEQAFCRLEKGDFNIRLNFQTGDEFQTLSATFNKMSEQMERSFKKIENSRDELDKIINSVTDAIMVTDANGKILLSNLSFKNFFPGAARGEMFYWQIINDKQFVKHITEKTPQFVFEYLGKHYLCTAASISTSGSFVTVFHDITDMKNLENFKKDLIASVSHELKTPLSSIKAYTEFLETETSPEQIKRYVSVISRNTARLSNIVNDLLTLSEIENSQNLKFETFKLSEIFNEMSTLFSQRAKSKGIVLHFTGGGVEVKADKFRLEQAVLNLIDNALRYTETGTVTVSANADKGNAVITVEDTGIGIDAAHLERIFDRFYVADKSRSRKTGGTGLGLSIVKHIIALHGGVVTVASTPLKGSVFTITLPAV